MTNEVFPNSKTVYGPVRSWRLGESVGIDPIFETSTCSFNCIYCQLGNIQRITTEIKEYVPTQKIVNDFKELVESGKKIDVITFSGSGEPTLAANLKEIIIELKKIAPEKKFMILTNGTELDKQSVRKALSLLDKVIVKIDSANEQMFQRINRPAEGVNLATIISSIKTLKNEYPNLVLDIQTMFMPINKDETLELAKLLKEIQPNEVQLNTPKRPYPLSWHRENRGNHLGIFDYEVRELKKVSKDKAEEIEEFLRKETGLSISSVYK